VERAQILLVGEMEDIGGTLDETHDPGLGVGWLYLG
jgi:hypothetical protein